MIIEVGPNRFIGGEPDKTLATRHHWCDYCGGDGLDYDFEGELTVCSPCFGRGQVECGDKTCPDHARPVR
jgi:hypothetical protein